MKKIIFASLLAFNFLPGFAQVEKNGFVVLNDGHKIEGNLTEQFKKNKSIQLTNAEGQSSFDATVVKAATIGAVSYKSLHNEYYEIISETARYSLLEKETKASGSISYNGTEPIIVPSTEGKVNDLFIFVPESNTLILLTKKNYRKKIQSLFPGCTAAAEAGQVDFSKITVVALLQAYNACN